VDPGAPDPGIIARAAALLRAGELVGLPTETVYGLAADARNPAAVRRIFAVKGRPADNPIIVHIADAADLSSVARRVTPLAAKLARRWWPGPLTLVLEAAGDLPSVTTGGLSTVAVRVPDHPVALAVLHASGLALAAPSANRSGRPSPTTAAHVLADLHGDVALVLDAGPSRVGIESTVVDARGERPVVLRPGAVAGADLGLPAEVGLPGAASPGTRYRHYAPSCRVEIAPIGQGPTMAAEMAALGPRVGLLAPGPVPPGVTSLGRPSGPSALARCLYAALRAAELAGLEVVVVEAVPEEGLGAAVMDRLERAAAR